eukprot:TRINITY_DN2170_c0_g1_i3.p1 TRINITY_DN2170_c0_g1~~TRINITY_DN2170_c0_g1_i3.p1  ORF type:complete len:585 (+),score=88.20 TRINITY_DN2170_c0_g1_i3:108-1757(+)
MPSPATAATLSLLPLVGAATSSGTGCVNLLAIGDFGSWTNKQKRVAGGFAKAAEALDPAALVSVGDNLYPDGARGNPWRIAENWGKNYLQYKSLRRPWYMITGNHDWYSDARVERDFTDHWLNTNDGGWWRMPDFWYKTNYTTSSGVTIDAFHIDTEVWVGSHVVDENIGWADPKMTQLTWLVKELERSTADWKIVFGHHPVYSAGHHGTTHVLVRELDPLMREHGVTMYVSGHDHSKQILEYEGMTYIVTGAGGAALRQRSNEQPEGSLKGYWGDGGFVGFEFCDDQKATMTVYGEWGHWQHEAKIANKAASLSLFIAPKLCGDVLLRDAEQWCSEDGCRVLAHGMRSKSCDTYCRAHGLECSGGWEEEDEMCEEKYEIGCWKALDYTSDVLCQCEAKVMDTEPTPTPTAEPTTAPSPCPATSTTAAKKPEEGATSTSTSTLAASTTSTSTATAGESTCRGTKMQQVQAVCSEDGCKVAPLHRRGFGGTCSMYCQTQQLACRGGWETSGSGDTCEEAAKLGCDAPASEGDILCECTASAASDDLLLYP